MNPMQLLQNSQVVDKNMQGVIRQALYDTQTYPAAGANLISFFKEGVGFNGKTLAMTNLDDNGKIPTGQNFVADGIEVWFMPAQSSDSGAVTKITDDYRAFANSGVLILKVSSKDFLTQAPLGSFPPSSHVKVDASTTVAATNIEHAFNEGQPYEILPLALNSNVNFSVKLEELPPLPSGQDGKIIVKLNGTLYRNVQ